MDSVILVERPICHRVQPSSGPKPGRPEARETAGGVEKIGGRAPRSERLDRASSDRVETARAGFIIGSTAMRVDCAANLKRH